MKRAGKRRDGGRSSSERLLALLGSVLLLAFAGACRDGGSATTAGQEGDATVETAHEAGGDTLARLDSDVKMGEPAGAAGSPEDAGRETGAE